MACSLDFIEFVSSQIATAGTVKCRKMFGDYMVYVDEKPVIIVCDNIPYVKEHEAIKSMMLSAERGSLMKEPRNTMFRCFRSDFAVRVVKTLSRGFTLSKEQKEE